MCLNDEVEQTPAPQTGEPGPGKDGDALLRDQRLLSHSEYTEPEGSGEGTVIIRMFFKVLGLDNSRKGENTQRMLCTEQDRNIKVTGS